MTRTFRNVLADPPTLATGIDADDTSATLSADPGIEMPTTGPFSITIDDERIDVGSRSGVTLSSLTRACDGTTAAAHDSGAEVTHVISRSDAEAFVQTDDSRLTDDRDPTAHAASHATAGSDPISPSDIGAATSGHNHSGVYDPAGTAASAVSAHESDTTSVHGIADTSALYRSGGTDVAVADGGTGASTASGARTNLGLVIGTDVASQGHTHANLPTTDEKGALASAYWSANPLSASNPLVAWDLVALLAGSGASMGGGYTETNDTATLSASSVAVEFDALGVATQFSGQICVETDNAGVDAKLSLVMSDYDVLYHVKGTMTLPDGTVAQITADSDEIAITLPSANTPYSIPFMVEASVDDFAGDLKATATWYFGPATASTLITIGPGHMRQVGF